MRYAVLLVGFTLVLAGCIGGTSPGTEIPGSPTDDASPTATMPPGDRTRTDDATTETPDCEEAPVTTVDPAREEVTPSALPERPEVLNSSSAASFAEAYEKAYKRNTGLESETTKYEVWTENVTTTEVEGGYVVTMTAGYWYNAAEPSNGTATPTVVHADGPQYRVGYFVGDDRVRRDTTLDDETLSPRAGTMVECWSSD